MLGNSSLNQMFPHFCILALVASGVIGFYTLCFVHFDETAVTILLATLCLMLIAYGILLFSQKPTWLQSLVFLSTYVAMVGVVVAVVGVFEEYVCYTEVGGPANAWLLGWLLCTVFYAPVTIVALVAAYITKLSSSLRATLLTVFLGVLLAVMGITLDSIGDIGSLEVLLEVLLVEVGSLSVLFLVVAGILRRRFQNSGKP